jgi:hypothetical protein
MKITYGLLDFGGIVSYFALLFIEIEYLSFNAILLLYFRQSETMEKEEE